MDIEETGGVSQELNNSFDASRAEFQQPTANEPTNNIETLSTDLDSAPKEGVLPGTQGPDNGPESAPSDLTSPADELKESASPDLTSPADGPENRPTNRRSTSEPVKSEEEEEEFEDIVEEEVVYFEEEGDDRPVPQEAAGTQVPEGPAKEAHQTISEEVPATAGGEASSLPVQGAEVVKVQEELPAEAVPATTPPAEVALQEPASPASGGQVPPAEEVSQAANNGTQVTDSGADAPHPDNRSDSDAALDKLVRMTPKELEDIALDELENLCNKAADVSPEQRNMLFEVKKKCAEANVVVSNAKDARNVISQEKENIDRKLDAPVDQRNEAASNWTDAMNKVAQAGVNLGNARDELTQALASFQTDLAKPAPTAPASPPQSVELLSSIEPPSSIEPLRPAAISGPLLNPSELSNVNSLVTSGGSPSSTRLGGLFSQRSSADATLHSGSLPFTGTRNTSQTGTGRFFNTTPGSSRVGSKLNELQTLNIPVDSQAATQAFGNEGILDKQLESKAQSVGEMRMALQQMLFVSILTTGIAAYGNRQLEEEDAAGRAFTGYVIALGVR